MKRDGILIRWLQRFYRVALLAGAYGAYNRNEVASTLLWFSLFGQMQPEDPNISTAIFP